MTKITTLSQFLNTANTQFQVYDMGRRVQHIDMAEFKSIEDLLSPYPSPIQGHAQFAIVFWDQSQHHYIWFIKLPLDEQGLLQPAARTQFIKMIVEALGRDPTQTLTEQQQEQLANHPFSFKPPQEKLAIFNALVRKKLKLALSPQYQMAFDYLSAKLPAQQWQQIGLQGIADICVRLDETSHVESILQSFDKSADEVNIALCQCLEHLKLEASVINTIFEKFIAVDQNQKAYYLRAMASSMSTTQRALHHLNEHGQLTADMLVTLAARNWEVLTDPNCRKIFFEALALQSQQFFNQIFADLVSIPIIRSHILAQLRNPERSAELSAAIGGLFKEVNS